MARRLRKWAPIAVLIVASITITYPFLTRGLADGGDRGAHLEYQHFFNLQIAAGELYPRWMPGLNLGRGSPIFFVQYPLPYYVAWALGHLIPNHWGIYTETHTQGLAVVLALTLGALFTHAWCSAFVDRLSAMFAALVFITLPYLLFIDLYSRDAVGETWALALMPLALYFLERRAVRPRRSLAGLAAVFALILCSHPFTAVLFCPISLAYAAWRSVPAKRWIALWQTAAAVVLGIALAGVYSLPLLDHSRFMHSENILAVLGANYSPLSQMFPYDGAMFPRDTPGWHLLGQAARYLAATILGLVGYAWYRSRREGSLTLRTFLAVFSIGMLGLTFMAGHLPDVREVPGALPMRPYLITQRAHFFLASFLTLELALACYWALRRQLRGALADFLVGMALLSYWMMTRWSLIVWQTIHPLWTMQFPWRFNVFLALATTGLAALAISNLSKRPLLERVPGSILAIVLWGLVAGGTAVAGHLKDAFWGTQPVAYQPSRDSALPLYAHVKTLQEVRDVLASNEATLDVVVTSGKGTAEINMVNPRLIDVHATCESDCTLRIGQFYYPAWRAKLVHGGTAIPLRASSPGGLTELSLPAGETDVVLELPRSWTEQIGPWVSLVSLIAVVVLALSDKPRTRQLSSRGPLSGPDATSF
jgi:hypothetical protein